MNKPLIDRKKLERTQSFSGFRMSVKDPVTQVTSYEEPIRSSRPSYAGSNHFFPLHFAHEY